MKTTLPAIKAIHVLSSMRPNQAPERLYVGCPCHKILAITFEPRGDLKVYVIHFENGPSLPVSEDRVPRVEWTE